MAYAHVLAVTDGSPEADRAVEAACELAYEHRARLTVATVVELEHPGRQCGLGGATAWNDVLRDAARQDLIRAQRIVRIPADYEIFYGSPVDAVANGATELGCDVIVMPCARGLRRVLHRDRTPALARRVQCAVIQPE